MIYHIYYLLPYFDKFCALNYSKFATPARVVKTLNFHNIYDFFMILRKIYKIGEKVSNLRYSPSSPYFYNFTVGASLCTILISLQS